MPAAQGFEVSIARRASEIAAAEALRERVFAREDRRPDANDRFAGHCEHLVIRNLEADELIASCRLLAPKDAGRAGGNDANRDFDLALLIVLRERMVEIDHPCVHPHHAFEPLVALLWLGVARYVIENGYDYVLGRAAVDIRDGGHVAASVHRLACARFLSPEDYRVYPRRRLPLESLSDTRRVTLPSLLRSYLDFGAWVCGEPALVSPFVRSDFPVLVPLARMQVRHARRFLAQAA